MGKLAGKGRKKRLKKFFIKICKKGIDKRGRARYNRQAVTKETGMNLEK